MAASSDSDSTGEFVLILVLVVGIYLLYKSLSNLGSSITGAFSSAGAYWSGVGNTAAQEASNVGSALLSPFTALSNVGTNLYNATDSLFGGSSSSSATGASLSDILSPTNFSDAFAMPDDSLTSSDYLSNVNDTMYADPNSSLTPSFYTSNEGVSPLPDGSYNGETTTTSSSGYSSYDGSDGSSSNFLNSPGSAGSGSGY